MEFVNTNFKSKQSKVKVGKVRGKYTENGGGESHHLNQQQYQQFVNNAIERGRGRGGQSQGHGQSYGGLQNQHSLKMNGGVGYDLMAQNNGILQALQSPQSQGKMTESSGLGALFQDLTQVKSNNRGGGSETRDKVKGKGKNGGGYCNNSSGVKVPAVPLLETHEDMTKRLNNEALLRVDSAFFGLFGSASQVAVYDYDAVTKDWVDTKTCGPLFLYNRTAIPEYGLVVLNRKGMKNLNMTFDKQSQIIPHEPYLLFRRGPDEVIKCIWFYKDSEFHEALKLFRTMGVHFDQSDATSTSSNSAHVISIASSSSLSVTSTGAAPNLFDMLKQSQAKIDGSNILPTPGTMSKIFTAEEVEQQMLADFQPSDKPIAGPGSNITKLNVLGLGAAGGGVSLLQQISTGGLPVGSGVVPGSRVAKNKSGDSEDSLPLRLNDASRSMRTVEQLEKALMPEDAEKNDMSNELLATLGIKPIKDLPESCSEIYTPQSPFLTPTSRSISDSERSQKKLTIDDLDGKLYEETDEDMVREVVDNLADLTELLLLSENVSGHSEPQLVWRKRSNLQNRPSSALIQVPHINGIGNGTPNMHQKHSIINNRSSPAISPLTENQLLQAITYLLQTEPSFIGKIHEAYVKSLQQSWATNRLG